ncbi:MAG: fibronectin type III domain-containing protein [Candidatus Sigynarchaeota archaeon]
MIEPATKHFRKSPLTIFLRIYGIILLVIGAAFIIVFYIFFAASNGVYFAADVKITFENNKLDAETSYPYPQIGPTFVQAIFPFALGIVMFAVLLFGYVAISNFKRPKPNKPANITALAFAILAVGAGGVMDYFASSNIPFWYYDAGPYLTWSNGQDPATSITVSWHSAMSTGSSVRYGTSPGNLDHAVSKYELTQFHHVPITGLQPNTTYYYRVDASPFSMKQFTTAPRGNASFSFVVWSDPRENNGYETALKRPNLPPIMLQQSTIAGKPPAFSICCGDITSRGQDFNTWKLWLQDITTNDFASNTSQLLATGNHEKHDDIGQVNLHKFYPYTNTTFSFDYGQLHVVILDIFTQASNADRWWTKVPSHLLSWMYQDFQASHATFKILALHPTPINADGTAANDTHNGDIGADLFKLASDCGLDAIFSGHSHRYTHALNGLTHMFTLGIGGNDNNNFGTLGLRAGYCRVDITSTTMIMTVINATSGSSLGTFTITK